MTCKQFFLAFSDYHDGVASDDVVRRVESHLAGCASCRQYERVVSEGVSVLRGDGGEGAVDVPADFHARLRHRLFRVDEEEVLLDHSGSGATALAVLSIALVLTAVAWSPLLRPGVPQVELSPLVVSSPPAPVGYRPANAFPFRNAVRAAPAARNAGLWDDAPELLFEYSRLSQRYRQRAQPRPVDYPPDR